MANQPEPVALSVVIPAYNASATLPACLEALASGSVQPHEVIIVDDGSDEDTAAIARPFGARVLSTGGRQGPAAARNIGAKHATGEIILFLDSDVCVHRNTLERILNRFREPDVDAVIGSYDDQPTSPYYVSKYRNLLHHYTHQTSSGNPVSFWSGCGAIRKSVFLNVNGFDASYLRPCIEDIELGYRLHMAGHSVILDPAVQATHLKRWTFGSMVKTDVVDRGIPWTLLILRAGRMPNDLAVKWSQRLSVICSSLMLLVALIGVIENGGRFLTPLTGTLLLTLASFWISEAIAPGGRMIRIALVASITVFAALAGKLGLHAFTGLVVGGYTFLLLRELVSRPCPALKRPLGWIYGVYFAVSLAYMMSRIPHQPVTFVLAFLFAVTVLLNARFYVFLFSKLGKICTVAALPVHIFYHLYSGLSFAGGLAVHYGRKLASGKRVQPG